MQTKSRFMDDLTRVASGAASTIVGIKDEIDAMIRQRVERLAADLDLVTRDEFEAARETAANARAGEEALTKRVSALEKEVAALKKARLRTTPADTASKT
jgi:BMFP domain-containing protein YqiC